MQLHLFSFILGQIGLSRSFWYLLNDCKLLLGVYSLRAMGFFGRYVANAM